MNEPSEPATSGNEGQTTDGNICPVEGEEGQTPEPAEKPSGEPASDESDKGANEGEEQSSDGSTSRAKTWQERFLAAMGENFGNIFKACCAAKVSRLTVNKERAANSDFAAKWDEIQEGVTDRIEERGIEQAIAGEPRLIPFFLGARRRTVYGEKLEVTGSILHGHVAVTPELLSQKAAEALQSFSPLMKALTDEKAIDVESEKQ